LETKTRAVFIEMAQHLASGMLHAHQYNPVGCMEEYIGITFGIT